MNLKNHKSFILILIVLFFSTGFLFSQETETDEQKNKSTSLESIWKSTRTYKTSNALANKGNAQYLRFSVHDGNLVTGGSVNSGLLSYHYVGGSPTISWPKGSQQVSYVHSTVFYVGSEVIDTRGDTIQIISDNYRRSNAESALDQSHFYATMPLPGYFNSNQPGATSPYIGGISEDVGKDGIPNTDDEGEGDGILQNEEDFNSNGVLDLSMINNVGWFSITHKRETWPEYWPAGSYPGDDRDSGATVPGARAGRWNGEYGAYVRADQESYYIMDDRENDEFLYYPFDDAQSKQPWPNGRRGLGLTIEVRNYQWNARLAEDIWVAIYDITNKGKDLDKAVVGMYVDPDMGGSLSGDDASFDEIDDITYAWNVGGVASNGLPIGYFGFAFLESPGLGKDGIDNDQDGIIDESQSNAIDEDGDWRVWEDQNGNGVYDNEDLNYNGILDEGEDINGNGKLDFEPLNDDLGSDGLGPEFDEYTGPDSDGTEGNGKPDQGEPNFGFTDNDESDQVGLTSFYLRDVDDTMAKDAKYWEIEIFPGTFEVRPGYQRDIAWSYGSGFVKFAEDEKTHRYGISLLFGNDEEDIIRNKRTMQVIYDEDYNFAKPPKKPLVTAFGGNKKVFLKWDDSAERSRDPIYGFDFEAYYIYKSTDPAFDDIKTITDAFGNPFLFKPLEIYDIDNGLTGIHPVRIGSEVGEGSDLGVSYNMGTDSGLKHHYIDTNVTNGRSYYYAIVSVDRGYVPEFYPEISDREGLLTISPTECNASIQVDLLGRAVGTDRNTVIVIPQEPAAGWVEPKLADEGIEHVSGLGTGSIQVKVVNEINIRHNNRYRLEFGDDGEFEKIDSSYTGLTNKVTLFNITEGLALRSIDNPDINDLADEFIEEGIQISIDNIQIIEIDTAASLWTKGNSSLKLIDLTNELRGTPVNRDYELRVMELPADTSVNNKVTNFQIWDITNEGSYFKVGYRYTAGKSKPDSLESYLGNGDRIIMIGDNGSRLGIFDFIFPEYLDSSMYVYPKVGDTFKIVTSKPFDRYDAFEFTINGNFVEENKAKNDLNNIYTIPDPYISYSTLERKVINEDEGRGERRIDFVNLPQECKIHIFTTSGRLVRTLDHSSTIDQSRESWDLRTKDGLEVSHGIYYYVVEAPGIGNKTGRLAIIK